MLMLLLSAKFWSVGRNRGKIAKQKLIKTLQPVFCQTDVERFLCFCFFGTKKNLKN